MDKSNLELSKVNLDLEDVSGESVKGYLKKSYPSLLKQLDRQLINFVRQTEDIATIDAYKRLGHLTNPSTYIAIST